MSGTVILETERLILRHWRVGDLTALQSIICDQETMSHWPKPFDEVTSAAWLARAVSDESAPLPGRLGVYLKSDGSLIGDAGLARAEINGRQENDLGYIIHRNYWRHGYGLEVAHALLSYGHKTLGCDRVIATMAEDNLPSIGLAKALGMTPEGCFPNPGNLGKTHLIFVSAH